MKYYFILGLISLSVSCFCQKMLILERANSAKTTKMYVGETLRYRLAGKENYWYEREITEILPETKTLLLDNFPVKLDSIVQIKVNKRPIWRFIGGTLFTFGGSLAFATTVAALYRDKRPHYAAYYGTAAGSMALGAFLTHKRCLKLGKKHRLRIIEIKFPEPMIPPPPVKH